MRILFTSQPGSGHWRPLVPLARALQEGGHEVAFVMLPAHCRWIEAAGLRCFPMGVDDDHSAPEGQPQPAAVASAPEQAGAIWSRLFAGQRAERCLPDLLELCGGWRPALIVREISEFAGCIAAERLGLPHVAVQVSAFRPWLQQLVSEPLNTLRVAYGLAPDPDLELLYRHLLLSPLPPSYRAAAGPFPPTTHAMRRTSFDVTANDELPAWLTSTTRPIVYATLGTAYNRASGVFDVIISGLRDEPIELVVTVGPGLEPADFGPQPDNVHIHRYIPHSLLLPHCDLVLCHGGFGTLLDALAHGLPQVLIPIAADQPDNVRQCVELGVAELIVPGQREPAAIRRAVRRVLTDRRYRDAAGALAAEMQALPTPSAVVPLLEQVAERR